MRLTNDIGCYVTSSGTNIGEFNGAVRGSSITTTTAAPFVGPLDELIAQGAVLRHASSVRRLLSSYTGPACRITETGFYSEADFSFLADGTLDINAINNFADIALNGENGPFSTTWQTAYDQSGLGRHATQTIQSSQPLFGTSIEAKGAMQATLGAKSLNVDLSPLLGGNDRPFFVLAVVNVGSSSSSAARFLLGFSTTASVYIRQNLTSFQSAWATQLSNGIGPIGKKTLGAWVNSVSSTNYINGVYQTEGDTGNAGLSSLLPVARIGRGQAASTSWFSGSNNTISEFLVFNNDPTLLAGWPAFVAAQNAHFDIV